MAPGDELVVGAPVGECGNSGNSTEPHIHLQAMDRLDMAGARGLPISFGGRLPRNRDVVEA